MKFFHYSCLRLANTLRLDQLDYDINFANTVFLEGIPGAKFTYDEELTAYHCNLSKSWLRYKIIKEWLLEKGYIVKEDNTGIWFTSKFLYRVIGFNREIYRFINDIDIESQIDIINNKYKLNLNSIDRISQYIRWIGNYWNFTLQEIDDIQNKFKNRIKNANDIGSLNDIESSIYDLTDIEHYLD